MKTCDHCGKDCATRVAVVLPGGSVADVGSACARQFKRARASDLIRSYGAGHSANSPGPKTETQEALLAFLQFQSSARKTLGVHRPKGFKYSSMEEYVLQNGRLFDSAPLTAEERKRLFDAIDRYGRRFPIKQCYYNSQMLLLFGGEPGFKYVEGYASSIFPILHGWLTLNGKVIDLTMRVRDPKGRSIKRACRLGDRVLGVIPSGRAYMGVEFPTEDVRRHMVETGAGGSLIDDWRLGYPLLRETLTKNDHGAEFNLDSSKRFGLWQQIKWKRVSGYYETPKIYRTTVDPGVWIEGVAASGRWGEYSAVWRVCWTNPDGSKECRRVSELSTMNRLVVAKEQANRLIEQRRAATESDHAM